MIELDSHWSFAEMDHDTAALVWLGIFIIVSASLFIITKKKFNVKKQKRRD